MKEVVITSAVRTPIGAFCGSLREVPVEKMGALVLNEAIKRSNIKSEQVEEVVMSQAYANGEGANVARFALLEAGWPVEIPGYVVDRRCCCGLQSVWNTSMLIETGYAEIAVASGAEAMSRAEFYVPGDMMRWGVGSKTDPKWGFFPRNHGSLDLWGIPFYDRIQRGRPNSQPHWRFGELNSMMTWAEKAAAAEKITREEADAWALGSHQKAIAAMDAGRFKEEIVPVPIPGKKGEQVMFDADETPRRDTTIEKLAKLKVIYEGGVCTAGNSSAENDAAGALVLMAAEKAKELNLEPMAYCRGFGVAGAEPDLTYPAVPAAVNKALKRAGLTIKDMDLIEIQEAFAVQTLADAKLMGLTKEEMENKVNVNGSGISLGHPIGATGVVRLVTLLYEMKRRNARYGLLTICGGGGLGICGVFERK